MADFETDFNCTENNSIESVPYQFEPLLQYNSANIITESSSSEDYLERGGAEEEHISELFGNTDWRGGVFSIEANFKIKKFSSTIFVWNE